jgi:hypothetical protein
MTHPLIQKIVEQGVSSVNVSMLSPDAKKKIMTEAGNTLMHLNRYQEAAQAYAVGENNDLLKEQGHWFLKQNRFAMAAFFLLHVEKEETLENLAQQCITAGELEAAKAVYRKLGNTIMLQFLEENFAESL